MSQRTCVSPSFRDRGFALVSAIFLIVILAALAGFIVVVSTHQQAGHTADIQGSRAYQAARAGVEWGIYNFKRNNACATGSSFNPGGGLGTFTVTVDCLNAAAAPNDEAGTGVTVRRIVVTACNQPAAGACPNGAPGDGYVERRLSVVAGR